jgi:hypothetical protein
LELKIVHPDYLHDVLTRAQLDGWFEYFKARPFGHWVQTQMLDGIRAAWTGKSELPKVEISRDKTEEELIQSMPGAGGAMVFWETINGRNQDA